MVNAPQLAIDFTGPLPVVQERAQQRAAERDRSLEAFEHGKHAEDIEIAHSVAVQLAALDPAGCTTAPRLQAELERRGLIPAGGDTRWLGGVLTRKRWARPVGLWKLREGSNG